MTKFWLVAVFLARMDAYGTESMQQCHAILASAERHEFQLLPPRLVHDLATEGAVDLTCLDHETMLQIYAGFFGGRTPMNRLPDIASDPRYFKRKEPLNPFDPTPPTPSEADPADMAATPPKDFSNPNAVNPEYRTPPLTSPMPMTPLTPEPDPSETEELPPNTNTAPLPYPKEEPSWKRLSLSPKGQERSASSQEQMTFPMPMIGQNTVLDEWGNPVWK